MRRRLENLEAQREEMLHDLGGLGIEMLRFDEVDEDLLARRAAEVAGVQEEIELLRGGLGGGRSANGLKERTERAGGAPGGGEGEG
jgi:hypothetical protein